MEKGKKKKDLSKILGFSEHNLIPSIVDTKTVSKPQYQIK